MRHTPLEKCERMQLTLTVVRDPGTHRFDFTTQQREDFGPIEAGIRRDCSPTRFAVLFHALCQMAVEAWQGEVAERWDDALGRELVDTAEVVELLTQSKE